MPDKLDTLMHMQSALQDRLGYDLNGMGMRERTQYIKEYMLHAEHELHEMVQELPYFKPWKQSPSTHKEMQRMVDKAKEEYIDVLHFMLNIALALGFTADELYDGYIDKNMLNHRRQEQDGYKRCVDAVPTEEV